MSALKGCVRLWKFCVVPLKVIVAKNNWSTSLHEMGPKCHVYNENRHKAKAKFSPDDDEKLKEAVKQFGTSNWELVAASMPNRNARQCRDRWYYFHAPNICTEPWTQQEDEQLLQFYETFGARWVRISHYFHGRTDTHIKNRWLVLQRRLKKYGTYKDPSMVHLLPGRSGESSPPGAASVSLASESPTTPQAEHDEAPISMNHDPLIDFWDDNLQEEMLQLWDLVW